MRSNNQHGFTIVELTAVIAIIAILVAVALPRFSRLSTQAYTAANAHALGVLRSAINIAHAAWIVAGAPSTSSVVTLEGWGATLNGLGWRNVGGNTSTTSAWCVSNVGYIRQFPQTVADTADTCTDSICYVTTSSGSVCIYTLNGAGIGINYDVATGNVSAF